MDEQKILDTLRYVGRHFRRAIEELNSNPDELVLKRLRERSVETLGWVENALEEFVDPEQINDAAKIATGEKLIAELEKQKP